MERGRIYDMCWSSILNRFIVIGKKDVFLINQNNLSTEEISSVGRQAYCSCACFDKSLYISMRTRGSSIIQCDLLPTIRVIKDWSSPDSCQKDETISHMRYNNKALALLITNRDTGGVHIELKASETFQRLWLLRLDIENVHRRPFYCCVVNNNEWLIADNTTKRLIHITNKGKMESTCNYHATPINPCMSGADTLAIINSKNIAFHKL